MPHAQRSALGAVHEGEVLQLPGERRLVDHPAARAEDVVLHAADVRIALHGMEVAGDHRVDAGPFEERLDLRVPSG